MSGAPQPPAQRSTTEEIGDPQAGLSLDVPAELIKDPRSWSVEDIAVWLHWLGIGEHAEAFAAQGIDGRCLLQLSAESAWAELGVVDPAQQRVLESAVEPLSNFHDSEGAESSLALHAIEGPVQGEVFYIGAGGITGGRHSASNGVVLSENYVSRRHFQITRDFAGQYLLQDVGSTTGTFLVVREELELEDQMVFQLGTTELTVRMDGDVCSLVATDGPDKDVQAIIPPQGLFIGREAASNGLCIRDPQISAFHCEVRPSEGGFLLDDKYSTNRTWLRLAPDGQPSRRYPLRAGDLFKVGSTLFHVIDPATAPEGPLLEPYRPMAHAMAHAQPSSVAVAAAVAAAAAMAAAPGPEPELEEEGFAGPQDAPQLRWEAAMEGEERPALPPEDYAKLLTASRRAIQAHAETSARRGWQAGDNTAGELLLSQDAGVLDVRERELSSLQQRMRNSRAQTAYALNQSRHDEGRRDEDTCKICYDKDIDVVLYPCGHFVLCRWCAQKVSDCPVCRFVITYVIRTYKA